MKLSPTFMRSLGVAVERFESHVHLAESYLAERGLWEDGILRVARLGVVAEPTPEYEKYEGRLVLPYLTPGGVVNIKFRCIQHDKCDGHKKYLGLPGAVDRLYNVQALHDASKTIHIAEGELDALSASVVGFPCVGISGASKWQAHYTKLFEDFEQVIVFAEGDEAGREFGKRIRGELDNARVVQLPDGEDVNSLLARDDFTLDDFEQLLA